ncbi:hypothetical protein FOA43_000393 [Brettanomyces nanus]|uniref:Uncharacterized protein n=1 Tax=Eeniella nana TaxID=13502 RepID=A0A875RWZ8_EENNA|nr:uncharacterized protein FOA43_000393 [Brettanomyces nanus]QPG73088.1 hypothetical protein FOA43_000393 [Brettanomyces nanus]
MWFGWGYSGDKRESGKNDISLEVPKDLSDYLKENESSISDREFKSFLKRSQEVEVSKPIPKEEPKKEVNNTAKIEREKLLEDEMSSIHQSPVKPTFKSRYTSTETEIYKRENPTREAVLTNCSEIQYAFMNCLRQKSTIERLTSMAKGNDECSMLADFLSSCMKMQKMALVMFDYSSLDKVEEFETAKNKVDKCFNDHFKNMDDIQDDKNYMAYTKELKIEREDFHGKFGK